MEERRKLIEEIGNTEELITERADLNHYHQNQIKKHCRDEHKWINPQKRGRQAKGIEAEENPWIRGVYCQHFFVRGPGAQYFEVAKESSPEPTSSQSGDSGFTAAKQDLEAALKKAEEEGRRKVAECEESRVPDPWLRRVGWAAHVGALDKTELRELVEPVGDDGPELETLCKAFEWMIQDAQYHAVREVVGQAALFEAHKKEVDKQPNMPFTATS
ncbi:MAG: hypothetical protein Q9171_002119 [Xanthocarpia ochracea]